MRFVKQTACASALFALMACSSAAQQPGQPSPSDVVASVGSTRFTLADVDSRAMQRPASDFGGARLTQAIYLARRAALDEMIGVELINQDAKTRGIEPAALVKQEITDRAPEPTEDDITFWYQTNPARVQGATLPQVHEAIRGLLREQRMNGARETLLARLRDKTSVTISLEPPRQQVAIEGHASKGPENAPIQLIEFSDFQCPFCQRANPVVEQVLKTYGDRIRFVYRHFPLPNHPNARPAAEASACAGEQGRFWQYHDTLFANPARLTDADLKTHAATAGLDAAKFAACFDGRTFKDQVDQDLQEGDEVGVTGTPAFFINGRSLEGAQPFEAFKRIIDEELAAKK